MIKPYTLAPVALALAAALGCSPSTTEVKSAPTASASALAETPVQAESERLAAFFERTFEEDLKRSPQGQSYRGIKWDYDKWNDYSDASTDEDIALIKTRLQELTSFDTPSLTPSEQLSLRLYKQQAEARLANDEFRHHGYIVQQFSAPHTMVPSFLINIHRIADESDANAYISRLAAVTTLFDQVIAQMRIREQKGIFPPAWAYPQMIEAANNVISGQPFDPTEHASTLLADFSKKVSALSLDDSLKKELIERATSALLENVKPAYLALIAELQKQMALSPQGDGVWRLPDGDKWYQNRLQWYTSTDLSAEQVHNIGLEEVARLHGAMKDIMRQVNFEGDLQAFFDFMRNDPQFYFANSDEGREQYLEDAKAAIEAVEKKLPEYFGLLPKAPMVVKRVEAFREKSAGKAFYQSPAQDGSRPGIYYANLYDMSAMPSYQLEALAYHEGIPGHHMQRAIAQELEGIPQFQKFLSATAYTEGWGLYTEELAKDMGFYKDPYSDFGRLAMELWRACRLVVDTGLHDKRWSREQAIAYLVENTPNAEYDAVKAIERYTAMPGQATAYMIGKLKIMALRQFAMDALGDKFSYAEFHDQILKDGPVPLSILEEKLRHWVEKRATRP